MSIKDGGPAYPFRKTVRLNGEPIDTEDYSGMSMRDHFAGLAMQGMLACGLWSHLAPDQMASVAYQRADSMLRAREAGQ